jgi:hypothetical protein
LRKFSPDIEQKRQKKFYLTGLLFASPRSLKINMEDQNMKTKGTNRTLTFVTLCSLLLPLKGITQVRVEKLAGFEKYDMPAFMRGPHVLEFWNRHNLAFRRQSAIHAAHGAAHDVVLLSPFEEASKEDKKFTKRFTEKTLNDPPKTEAVMQTYGPTTSQFAWILYRAINWTHVHHAQTYDILSAKEIPWSKKKAWTDKAVKYYLENNDVAMSPAPLDYTMRRVGSLMKPYLTYFRNYYPESNNYFYFAHWWHPAIYEAMMIGGNDAEQDQAVKATDNLSHKVTSNPPQRMMLSREIMPRYARLSPESANIFDNLHMLHGFAYDILTYPNWTKKQKEAELTRVIKALSYQPGDEQIARKLSAPYPNIDPRKYKPWMRACEGAMNDIMLQMLDEMMPEMVNNYKANRVAAHQAAMKKFCPGEQPGETPGSLHDAMMKIFPNMKKMPAAKKAGEGSPVMMQAMLAGWLKKQGRDVDLPKIDMSTEPKLSMMSLETISDEKENEMSLSEQNPGHPASGSQTGAGISGAKDLKNTRKTLKTKKEEKRNE